MKFLICLVVLIAVSQARPWTTQWPTPWPRPSQNCSIAADARAMESMFTAQRMIINLADPYKLQDYLKKVTATILKEIDGGKQFIKFIHLTHTNDTFNQIKMPEQSNQGYFQGLFNGVESLSQINTSNINYFLGDAHWEFRRLLWDLENSHSYSIKMRLDWILQTLIAKCQNIIKNGCKEKPSRPNESTTESPWKPDEGTTEDPWRPDEGTTEDPWRPEYGTTEDPWRPEYATTENPWRPEYGTTEDYWYH